LARWVQVALSVLFGGQRPLLKREIAAGLVERWSNAQLADRIHRAVHIQIEAETEPVLVIRRDNVWRHHGTMAVLGRCFFPSGTALTLRRLHGPGQGDTAQFDFRAELAILAEDPVDAVIVVAGHHLAGDDQFSSPATLEPGRVGIRVLPQNAAVALVQAD